MSSIGPKPVRFRLNAAEYNDLRKQVLLRDGWRCQLCGSIANLEIHHKQFRSHSGDDSEENLITLCTRCHSESHNYHDIETVK
jgi:5-methylcytosine-specific restriction endonuclease McrA